MMTLPSLRSWSRPGRCDALSTEVLVSFVAFGSSVLSAVLTHWFTRRGKNATADHTAVQTMELVVRNLRLELNSERAYRQELEQRVRHLENLIRELHGDAK